MGSICVPVIPRYKARSNHDVLSVIPNSLLLFGHGLLSPGASVILLLWAPLNIVMYVFMLSDMMRRPAASTTKSAYLIVKSSRSLTPISRHCGPLILLQRA